MKNKIKFILFFAESFANGLILAICWMILYWLIAFPLSVIKSIKACYKKEIDFNVKFIELDEKINIFVSIRKHINNK